MWEASLTPIVLCLLLSIGVGDASHSDFAILLQLKLKSDSRGIFLLAFSL